MTNEGEIRRFEKLSLRIDTDKTADAVATSEEAIYVLNLLKRQDLKINSAATEAIDIAISALKKQEADRWIPVTERLPEDDTEVFVYLFDIKSPYIAWICDGRWYTEEFEIEKENEPVAWRPLPEPYTEEEA